MASLLKRISLFLLFIPLCVNAQTGNWAGLDTNNPTYTARGGLYVGLSEADASQAFNGLYSRVYFTDAGDFKTLLTVKSKSDSQLPLYVESGGNNKLAAHFQGSTLFKGDVYQEGPNGKWVQATSFAAGQDYMFIAPNGAGVDNNWDFSKSLSFDASGELTKNVTNAGDDAFSVKTGGTTNFLVKGSGKAYATEIEVKLPPFPDYVFEDKYELLPLDALKKYIVQNRHLPNIPSAKEIEEEGIGLGDLSHKQMEKIEELTLYIIELDERLKLLEKENALLKEKANLEK